MDILAARKKAAERAREQKAEEAAAPAKTEAPGPLPLPEEQAAPVPPTQAAAGTGGEEPLQEISAPSEETAAPAAAGPSSGPAAGQEEHDLEMLSFRLGSEEYAVLVEDVKEVLKDRELTHVPNAPEQILGVTSLRGTILPVVDLRKRLGLPPGGRDERSRILVVTLEDEDTGIVVDRVTGVVRIAPASIRPAPETLEHGAEYLKGIARKDDRLYILLDIGKALTV